MDRIQFDDFDLSPQVSRAIKEMGFEETTPIQTKAIPAIMTGRDVIGQAQTGTGKTCAFAIPAIEMLHKEDKAVQVLVLCPTRELAIQTAEEFESVSKFTEMVRILPIYGGQSIERQINALKRRPQIIIGTPGRVMDHMRRRTLKLGGLKMLILDEADEMLSMGFAEDLDVILEKTPEDKQTVLFSATMPKWILAITRKYQKDPEHIKIAHQQLTVPSIEQYCIEVRESSKIDTLSRVIDGHNIGLALVFCNTKRKVDELSMRLQTWGYSAAALHGDIRQNERIIVLNKFKSGEVNILVATDVAARGIDVENIDAVFNYDIPNDEEYYVHRIGRTGRAGKKGSSYTFISGREWTKIKDIQRYTKAKIKMIKAPTKFDIEDGKMNALLKKISSKVAKGGDIAAYAEYVEQIVDEQSAENGGITTLDVAAMLLKMLAKKTIIRRTDAPARIKSPVKQEYNRKKNYRKRR
ncbi:MAG: DEAD/DEAH box helicase [Clostridia bacterium]|jgi:ATP-dependent RNA helicase DeaD|nr:DEAD/DEAH box helicase [Clostridia bacterium]